MSSKSEVSPPRGTVQEFCNSLAGMIIIGLVAGLALCTPLFIHWQWTGPETKEDSSGPEDLNPPPATQVTANPEGKQRIIAGDLFPRHPEQPTAAHEGQPTNDLIQLSNPAEKEQVDLAIRLRLMGRYGDAEKALRNPRSAEAKAMRALLIHKDNQEYRGAGLTNFDRSEAEKLAREALPKLRENAKRRPLSMYLLGGLYKNGLGVPMDLHEAVRLASEAASKGKKLPSIALPRRTNMETGLRRTTQRHSSGEKRAQTLGTPSRCS